MKLGVTYLGNRFVRHYAERDLPEIVAAGCDYVVHTVSEYDLAFHSGEISALVDATRQAGLEAWLDCWGLGGLFAGEAFSDFLLRHPESWQVGPHGKRTPVACPNAPAFRELLQTWIEAAARAGADVVFFDDPLAPAEKTCVCDSCREAQPAFLEAFEAGECRPGGRADVSAVEPRPPGGGRVRQCSRTWPAHRRRSAPRVRWAEGWGPPDAIDGCPRG